MDKKFSQVTVRSIKERHDFINKLWSTGKFYEIFSRVNPDKSETLRAYFIIPARQEIKEFMHGE